MHVRGILDVQLVLSDHNLKIGETCTDFGVIMNKKMKWHNHIENRAMKVPKLFPNDTEKRHPKRE